MKFLNKSFQDFLHHPNEEPLFIADKVNLISALIANKSTDPNNLLIQPKF